MHSTPPPNAMILSTISIVTLYITYDLIHDNHVS